MFQILFKTEVTLRGKHKNIYIPYSIIATNESTEIMGCKVLVYTEINSISVNETAQTTQIYYASFR